MSNLVYDVILKRCVKESTKLTAPIPKPSTISIWTSTANTVSFCKWNNKHQETDDLSDVNGLCLTKWIDEQKIQISSNRQTGRKVPSGEAGPFTDEQNLQQTDTFYDYQDYDDGLQDPTVSSSNVTSTNDVISSTTEQQITTTEQTTTTTTRLIIPPITEETPPTTINQEAE